MNQHGTALVWNNIGLLLIGPPGSGKSSLAMRLIDHGAELVADDQVLLSREHDQWIAHCPPEIQNQLYTPERGMIQLPSQQKTTLDLIVQSPLPADRLSQPPDLGLPMLLVDFTAENAIPMIRQYIMTA